MSTLILNFSQVRVNEMHHQVRQRESVPALLPTGLDIDLNFSISSVEAMRLWSAYTGLLTGWRRR